MTAADVVGIALVFLCAAIWLAAFVFLAGDVRRAVARRTAPPSDPTGPRAPRSGEWREESRRRGGRP